MYTDVRNILHPSGTPLSPPIPWGGGALTRDTAAYIYIYIRFMKNLVPPKVLRLLRPKPPWRHAQSPRDSLDPARLQHRFAVVRRVGIENRRQSLGGNGDTPTVAKQ